MGARGTGAARGAEQGGHETRPWGVAGRLVQVHVAGGLGRIVAAHAVLQFCFEWRAERWMSVCVRVRWGGRGL